ncbi:hypothetical protein L7F22_066999 [Adiantum nelumboides]|nr:hypothetical protein [Adiantum nelumboides]
MQAEMEGEVSNDPSPSPTTSPSSFPSPSPQFFTVKVGHGLRLHEITLPADTTFGDLKSSLAPLTGVCPHEQRLLFKGKEKEDSEFLHTAGLQNNSKLLLIETPESKARRLEEARQKERIAKACQAVAHVREEVDKLSTQVSSLEATIENGNTVAENTFPMLSELLMQQLLNLDSIEAEGEAKLQRKTEAAYGYTPLVPTNFVLQHKVALADQLVQEMQDVLVQVRDKLVHVQKP